MPPKKKSNTENGGPEAKKNKTSSDYSKLDFTCSKKSAKGQEWNFKISSWNVDGLRAWMKKGGLEFLDHEKPDVLCLQEIKCGTDKLPQEMKVNKGKGRPIAKVQTVINKDRKICKSFFYVLVVT